MGFLACEKSAEGRGLTIPLSLTLAACDDAIGLIGLYNVTLFGEGTHGPFLREWTGLEALSQRRQSV
jgi:hypothetical protein